jgi:type II secretory pathway pseudopilin PulG
MYCSKCGVENQEAKFCKDCGNQLIATENAPSSIPRPEADVTSTSKAPKSVIFFALTPILVFVGIIIFWGVINLSVSSGNASPFLEFVNAVFIPFAIGITFLAFPIGIIYAIIKNSNYYDGTIKCGNCNYVGVGKSGRSTWAQVTVWVLFLISPLITIIYYLATHKYICTKCSSSFVGWRDVNGSYSAPKNGMGPLGIVLIVFLGIAVIGILAAVVLASLNDAREAAEKAATNENAELVNTNSDIDFNYFNEKELVDFTKTYIEVLQRLYYINQDDSGNSDNVTSLLMAITTEALKDKNNLERLLITTNEMRQSKIAGANVTAGIVDLTINKLITANEEYIKFLRGVDETTLDMAEFQYQVSLFQSNTKDAYMFMGENTAIFQVTFFKLSDNPDIPGVWRISDESRKELVDEIELRFGDIFKEADAMYEQTQTTDITVYLVRSLEDLFKVN